MELLQREEASFIPPSEENAAIGQESNNKHSKMNILIRFYRKKYLCIMSFLLAMILFGTIIKTVLETEEFKPMLDFINNYVNKYTNYSIMYTNRTL